MKVDLSIIIVTYQSEKTVGRLLDSIKKSRDSLTKEVIVIDNQSSDQSVAVAKQHPLKPIILTPNQNLGFSRAVNLGINKSKGNYILLINPDCRVMGSALERLYQFASIHDSAVIVPRLVSSDGKPQASAFRFPTIFNAIKRDFFGQKESFGKYLPKNKVQKLEVAVMAAMFIPKKVFNEIGLLDERFFLYYEDVEFCRRLKKYKIPLYYYPKAKIEHLHGASGNFKSHVKSPLLASAEIYYGSFYSKLLNLVLWVGHKWQVILRRKRFRD